MSYAIVCFMEDENSIAIVPMSWIEDDRHSGHLMLIKNSSTRLSKMSESPSKEWAKYIVRILGVSGNYEKARQKLRTAEMWSDIDSSSESKARHRRVPKRLFDTDDEICVETRPLGKKSRKQFSLSKQLAATPVLTFEETSSVQQPTTVESCSAFNSCDDPIPKPLNHPCSFSVSPCSPSLSSFTSPVPTIRTIHSVATDSVDAGTRLILKLLTELKSSVNELQKQMTVNTKLLQTLTTGASEADDEIDVNLPLRNKAALDLLEQEVSNDKSLFKSLIKHIATKGGRDVKDATKRMMTEFFPTELAIQVNWTGQGGKVSFSKLKSANIIRKDVRRNYATRDARMMKYSERL